MRYWYWYWYCPNEFSGIGIGIGVKNFGIVYVWYRVQVMDIQKCLVAVNNQKQSQLLHNPVVLFSIFNQIAHLYCNASLCIIFEGNISSNLGTTLCFQFDFTQKCIT